jgi:hypothetical protein
MTYPFDAEKANEQVREITERIAGNGRALSQLAIDAYEQGVNTLLEFENKAAEATPVEWVKTAITTHASFVNDVTGAYVKAARAALV